MIDNMFEKWLNDTQIFQDNNSKIEISNRDLYNDIINSMKKAFEAGFNARLEYTAREYLQK